HLHVGLALPVDALLEPELDELLFARLAGEEFRRFGLEVVVLVLEDRNHMPGHVLQDLGILEGATLRGNRNWLHLRILLVRASDRAGRPHPPAARYWD